MTQALALLVTLVGGVVLGTSVIVGLAQMISSVFPASVLFDPQVVAGFSRMGSYMNAWNEIFPVHEVLFVIVSVMSMKFVVFSYRIVVFLFGLIRGVAVDSGRL